MITKYNCSFLHWRCFQVSVAVLDLTDKNNPTIVNPSPLLCSNRPWVRYGGRTTARRSSRIPRDPCPAWRPLWAGSNPTSGWRARGSPTPLSATAATAAGWSTTTTRKRPVGAPMSHVPVWLGKHRTSLRLDLWTWPFWIWGIKRAEFFFLFLFLFAFFLLENFCLDHNCFSALLFSLSFR